MVGDMLPTSILVNDRGTLLSPLTSWFLIGSQALLKHSSGNIAMERHASQVRMQPSPSDPCPCWRSS